MHGNFIVNQGKAKATDVNELIQAVQKRVKEVYGLKLITEVKKIGFNGKD